MSAAELFERIERRQTLVFNERTKLASGALDRLSTAAAAAGCIGPLASLSNGGTLLNISPAAVISTIARFSGD